MKKSQVLLKAFKSSIPIMAGYLVLGIGFGMLLHQMGYHWYWATISAIFIYAGSMQYVTLDLLAGGASVVATIIMTLFVNLRHLFYGVAFIDKYKKTEPYKPYLIFSLTDETFSVLCGEEETDKRFYFYLSLLNQFYWVAGCTLGALLGAVLKFNASGIEFSMTAIFVISFINQWQSTKQHLPALTGLIISIICLIIFKADNFLIPTMFLITIALFMEKKYLEGTNNG